MVCADAVLGARLRQHERHVGRGIERPRRIGGLLAFGLERELRLRVDDAVVVLDLVGELHARRAPAAPDLLSVRSSARRSGIAVNDQAMSLPMPRKVAVPRSVMVKRCSSVCDGSCGESAALASKPAGGRDLERRLAARAHDQHAAGRHRDRRSQRLRRLARANARAGSPAACRYRTAATPTRRAGNSPATTRPASRTPWRCAGCGRCPPQRKSRSPESAQARAAPSGRARQAAATADPRSVRAASSARSTWARHSASDHGSSFGVAI